MSKPVKVKPKGGALPFPRDCQCGGCGAIWSKASEAEPYRLGNYSRQHPPLTVELATAMRRRMFIEQVMSTGPREPRPTPADPTPPKRKGEKAK